nr:hypothetical protein Iba_chr13dCG11340 [Ipomoea batatas]
MLQSAYKIDNPTHDKIVLASLLLTLVAFISLVSVGFHADYSTGMYLSSILQGILKISFSIHDSISLK